MDQPIRVFVGTDVNGGCAECQMVFEYSLRKHASVPVDLTWMAISDDPKSFWSGWNTSRWSTPFSGFRYGIAEYCNYEGKAIYNDDDQLWLTDPLELWNETIEDPFVMTGKILSNKEIRHCVSLIDCQKFSLVAPPASRRKENANFCETYKTLTFPHTKIIDRAWNNYDGEDQDIDDIKLLHFTDMATNPGIKLAIKRLGSQAPHWYDGPIREHRRKDVEDVFTKYYNEAIEAGYKVDDYVGTKKIDYKKQTQGGYKANNGWG